MVPPFGELIGVGSHVGKYHLLARLGTGGMAEVFLGRVGGRLGPDKFVAIKRMRPELTTNPEFVNLFLEEARTASMLSHPNICHIHELARVEQQYLMVMEYLEGVPLSTVMLSAFRDPTPFGIPFIVGVMQQACEGMHHAHQLADEQGAPYGIIHRDVSPPNLFVTSDGVVKVLDFGIAKSRNSIVRTMTGQIRGKFSYMSPEQLRGHTLDARSDVFSLGIVIFEMFAARRLFRRQNRLNIFHAIVRDPIPAVREFRQNLTNEMANVVHGALARDRDQRYRSARELGDDLAASCKPYGGAMSSQGIAEVIRQNFGTEIQSKRELVAEGSDSMSVAPPGSEPGSKTLPHDAATVTEVFRGPPPTHPPEWIDTDATTAAGAVSADTVVDVTRRRDRDR